jgi:deazaflavin-dependent oxidoreductase (nitroreductase family)
VFAQHTKRFSIKKGSCEMARKRQLSTSLWRKMGAMNRVVISLLERGRGPGSLVLLLTTMGRKSGLPRVTPLQYEEYQGIIYIGSARGPQADWFKNLEADPHVRYQIKGESFAAVAEPITDPKRIADFLELRLRRHPAMIRLIMCAEGLPFRHSREDLEEFARNKAVVALYRGGQ